MNRPRTPNRPNRISTTRQNQILFDNINKLDNTLLKLTTAQRGVIANFKQSTQNKIIKLVEDVFNYVKDVYKIAGNQKVNFQNRTFFTLYAASMLFVFSSLIKPNLFEKLKALIYEMFNRTKINQFVSKIKNQTHYYNLGNYNKVISLNGNHYPMFNNFENENKLQNHLIQLRNIKSLIRNEKQL